MKKLIIIASLSVAMLMSGIAGAETGKELTENAAVFDGKQVSFQGEVIGMIIKGDNAWVNILDGGYAIGVRTSAATARQISFTGDYTHTGDTVLVGGTFKMSDPDYGGDMDIHAENFTVTARGVEILRAPNVAITAISLVLVGLAILSLIWLWRVHKGEEKITPWPVYWR